MEGSKKYVEYVDIIFEETVAELLKYKRINDHSIYLEEGKQLLYGPIYS